MTTPAPNPDALPTLLPGTAEAVILDAAGLVTNVIVIPDNEEQLGPAWAELRRANRLRRLTADERARGVGRGWRRSANGVLVDERPPTPTGPPVPPRG